MSDDIHEVYAVCYGKHGRMRSENYIFGDPHDAHDLDRLLRLGDQGAARHLRLRYRLRREGGQGARAHHYPSGGRGAQSTRRRARQSRATSSPPTCIGITPAITTCSPMRAITCRTPRWPTPPAAACATRQLRIPFSEDDVHAMVRKVYAYRVEFHDGVEELAPGITVHKIGGHSKGLQCVRVKTQTRLRGGRLRLLPLVFAHRRGPRIPHHLQRPATRSKAIRRCSSSPPRASTWCRGTTRT